MKKSLLIIVLTWLFFSFNSIPQTSELYIPRNIQQAYKNNTRSMDGKPGEQYWQNRADYNISVEFDPISRLLKGSEKINFINNSPDSLKEIIILLLPNFYKKGNMRAFDIDPEDESDGVSIEELIVNDQNIDISPDSKTVDYFHSSMKINLPAPITPGQQSILNISWHYSVNKGSHSRTGAVDSSSFFIAYFFPRIAVYDDVDGWNDFVYTGSTEFYNDFGDFDVSIKVPKDFIIWATGELQNPEEVLEEKVFKRYQSAFTSDSIIHIIDSIDLSQKPFSDDKLQNEWRFTANYVSDFAFALSDHYLWDASSIVADKSTKKRVLIDAAYNKDSKDFYETVKISKQAIEFMCYKLPGIPFPFPKVTIFNGLDEMEYPMMVNLISYTDIHETIRVTSHEIFHSYFPFYTGINETKYAWMDEGITTFVTYLISEDIDSPEQSNLSFYERYESHIGDFLDIPIFSVSDYVIRPVYYFISYTKPAAFFLVLKDLLGEEKFKKAFQEFIIRWNGKHPMPYDLFFTFTEAAGENLDWIIKPWMFEFGYVDLSIKDVVSRDNETEIIIEKIGHYPAPIKINVIYEDSSNEIFSANTAVWKNGNNLYSKLIPKAKKITCAELKNSVVIDADLANNGRLFN
jgi:hypothetical protein